MSAAPMPPRIKVVYILGSSRCGSTTLDGILGASGTALSTGELGHLHWALEEGGLPEYVNSTIGYCSCGALVGECPVWSKVVADWEGGHDLHALGREIDRYETAVRSIPPLAIGRLLRTRSFRAHLQFLAESARSVARVGGVSTIVDSTKGSERGWLYSLLSPEEFDVRFVHLVRDGRSVVSSSINHHEPHKLDSGPSPWPRFAATAFSTAHWMYMNLAASCLGAFHRPRYLRIRFEDLMADPATTLDVLERFLEVDLKETRQKVLAGEALPAGHLLCGNRSKGSPLRLGKERATPGETLTLGPSLVFLGLAGWLEWLYTRAWPRPPPARAEI